MKKLIALFLVITFIGMNCATYEKGEGINLEPGQKPGAKLVIQKKDGQQVRGELITVKKDSLLLKDAGSGADVTVEVSDIKVITIVKKSNVWKGVGNGFIIGVLAGGTVGLFAQTSEVDLPGGALAGIFGGIGGGIGALVGGIIGASAGKDKTIQIEGKSDSEIKEILEDLRKKARVSNFQ